ncbi:LOW QUALITY PROTEIN: epiplakin [Gastrophryne carolinensis]
MATPSIGGFFVSQTKEKVGIYQALQKKLISEEAAVTLLEAQAATGNITDPSNNQSLTVEAAVRQGVVGPEWEQKLLLAHSAAAGYQHQGETISIFQAFKRGLIGKTEAARFLQAQVATGGIIDHASGKRLTSADAIRLHYVDEDFLRILSGASALSRCYPDPNTKEDSTYQELVSKSFTDPHSGLLLLSLHQELRGLRRSVNLEELFRANVITQLQYDDVREGRMTVQQLGELQEVRQSLIGSSSIGGVYVESGKERLSVYQALKRNLVPYDWAVALLEAQAASGFLIEPEQSRTFTVTEAVQEGLVGLELQEKLLTAERAVTGFTDPYTGRTISLFQAVKKELIDRNLGLNLLGVQLATGGIVDPSHSLRVPLEVAYGRGLLDEVTAKLFSSPADGIAGFRDLNTNDRVTYQELRQRATLDPDSNTYLFHLKIAFQGIRGKVSIDDLLDSEIIDQSTHERLQRGQISVQDVAEQEEVTHYLQGTDLITGVAFVSTNEIKSIYQAMKEHLLMPGTSIALLEAQAATGYLTDPVKNQRLTVDEAVKNGLVGPELYEKLLSAEKASIGFRDPTCGEKLSLFQAVNRGFVPRDHGLHLLDVQLATGGIIDPSKKHRLPQDVASKRGHFHHDTYKAWLDQTKDVKGFFDPNLKENLTYGQVQERSLIDLRSGLALIPVYDEDSPKESDWFVDYKIKVALRGIKLTMKFGRFKGFAVSLWRLLFSEYFSVELRHSFIKLYKSGSLSAAEFSGRVETELKQLISSTKVTFKGLRETVTPGQLLESEIIDRNMFNKLQQGEASANDVVNIDTVRKYLQGTGSIAGLILTDTQEKISIYQAKRRGLLRPGTSLILLEAQAATGYIIDPIKNKKYSVDDALKANLIGPEYYEKLLSAEKSVTGYKDPYTGKIVSLFQAMSKDLIVKDHGIRLLEAQIATGGIIDPINSHRIPVEVAYKRGYFDKKMNLILSDPSDDTKGFFDPNTNENLTYLQLKERCINDPSSNLCLLPLISSKRQLNINDYIRNSFRNTEIYVRFGRFKGQTLSIWALINSEYFSEWRRRELLEQFRRKKLTIEQIIVIIEDEMKKWTEIQIPTLTGRVNFYELLEYEIIDRELFDQVLEGKVTTEEVLKMESVEKYLKGSGVLGGIVLQPSNQKISLYEATKKNILQPSTVLPLLEAQAATGFIVDPANNRKLSVDEALKAAVVDPQIYERLTFAEEAIRGYRDPFSGGRISLFQAMKKGLVEEKHARQLLEAQIATGGVIDPIRGFHLPVSAAKKLGYLSDKLLENFSRPAEETKFFYDPSTKQKVTYSELLSRSQKDESDGIYLLPLPQGFEEVPAKNIYSDEEVQQIFMSTRIEERNINVWELIHSGYFTEEERYEILESFKAKKLTVQELIIKLLQMVKINEIKKSTHLTLQGLRGQVPVVWLLDLGIISQQTFNELVQGLRSVEDVSQLPQVKECLNGTGAIAGVFLSSTNEKLSIYQALKKNLLLPANALMLLEAQAATGFILDPATNSKYTVDGAVKAGVVGPELHEKLIIAESAVTGYTDPYTGNQISLGQAIKKELISQKEGVPLLQAQLAAGGIIDTLHGHFVPVQLAFKLNYLDEEVWKRARDHQIYIDPNTKESVSYQRLKERCYTDPNSGALLLALESAAFHPEGHLVDAFKSFMVNVSVGRYKGQTVSLWELLNSEYINAERLKEFIFRFKKSSSEALQMLVQTVTAVVQETDAASAQIKFKGLRKQVSASDLFQSEVIDQKTLNELNLGKKTIDEVTEMESVRNYLEGTNCIAGVLLQSTNTKMSIYDAMLKRILRPGTALVLLEAQAATGFIIDPVKNEKLSVEDALAKGIIGHDVHAKLLSAEQAVTGYTDPYTGDRISLFQAMQKNLIVESHGIRLLEAQIATGGIIDPVYSHRIPVEVAYKRGYFSEEINKILMDPTDDTKGFFDPNTHENLTYLQLVERCVQDPGTGLYLLQVVKKGENYFYITDKIKADLQSRTIRWQFGRYANQTVSIWQILTSHYVTDLKRRELVRLYMIGVLSIDQLISSLTTITEEYEAKGCSLKFRAIGGEVSATDLYNADIIDEKTLYDLKEGRKSIEAISQLESVRRYLEGTGCIAGVISLATNETLNIYEAVKRGLLSRDVGLLLLQAQTATGRLTDPITNQLLSIPEALSRGLADADIQENLEIAGKAVTGFTDPASGNRLSFFQAIQKGILPREQGISLLEAQLATGGIVDPVFGFRLPLQVAYKRGYLDEDFYLLTLEAGRKGFIDPNTHERITYRDLLERCVRDPKTGLYLLQLAEKHTDYFYVDETTRKLLVETNVKVNSGKFKGQDISLWDLLTSTYISDEKRKELLKIYKTNLSLALNDIVSVIQSIIEENEKGRTDIWFQGLRKQVTAAELHDAGIINQETLDGLTKDLKSVSDVAKLDSVKQYLEGTSCIAGVLLPSSHDPDKKEKLNIYDAMLRRILRPGTALILLEAQAATGFVVDAIQNRKLSVDEALAAGVIGYDIYDKLLCAEKAVTGYTDPYTGQTISLFQAMLKDLIVKEHGIRLLEAQIATGGIIDPVHSHRVPVEVAYKRGYFDEDLNQVLLDPTDDTKGFFDPNSHENLTYLQLLQRCVQDPNTGLCMLELRSSRFSSSQIQSKLQSRSVLISCGEFQGRSISIWELLHSKYISEERRQELLKKLESGTLTIEEIFTMTIKLINEAEQTVSQSITEVQEANRTDSVDHETRVEASLQLEKVEISIGDFKGRSVSVWELLHSRYISQEKQLEILQKINSGALSTEEVLSILISIITEAELRQIESVQPCVAISPEQPINVDYSISDEEIQNALMSISINVTKGHFAGQEVSLWDLLNSKYIPEEIKQELLGDYKLTVQDIMELVVQSVRESGPGSRFRTKYNLKVEVYNVLQTVQIEVTEGEFKGQKHSVWYILNSKYLSEERRRELLEGFNAGTLSINELIRIIITLISETEERSRKLKFKGLRRQVTATELLTSEIIDQNTLRDLAQGIKTVEEVTQMDNVKRYLEGTSCIAGVLVPSPKDPLKKDKMSIYNAMLKNILRPGTALVLLEAQAATGFIIDPVNNKKLSVDEAAAATVIGQELHRKLLSAEKAVTGYTDPYTGDKISLFQAMQKELIVKDHGIRLLEAQIATGGIIDPVHSHRVPVEVAYKRGYFDEEMNQILSDPTDDTKGFFDPNTHENLTYLQLVGRCVHDPETGLYLLEIKDKKALASEKLLQTSLQSTTIEVKDGQYQGQSVSPWELLNSKYFTEEKRKSLLSDFQAKKISSEELTSIILSTIEDSERPESRPSDKDFSLAEAVQDIAQETMRSLLQSQPQKIPEGPVQVQKVTTQLLASKEAEADKKDETLPKKIPGVVTIEQITESTTVLTRELEEKAIVVTETVICCTDSAPKLLESAQPDNDEDRKALSVFTVRVDIEEFQGRRASLWEVLHSNFISEDRRNAQLRRHQVTVEKLKQRILKVIEDAESKHELTIQQRLQQKLTEVGVGEFRGQSVSIWFLLFSKYITEEKRNEMLRNYASGAQTAEEILKIIITIIEETERSRELKFKGLRRQVTATELLQSEIIDQGTLSELTQGSKTVEEVTQMDSVKRYLEGTSSIAGVFVTLKTDPSQREKLSIYDAMLKRILRPGTALILLEAQAATGFVIDPIQNKKLSVEEALAAGLIGHEIYEKLLSAERGVTGYNDPYTGQKISLFQAMKKDLIVKDHGIRLLEAQIATGGIIDPVHSHRVPVEVAYKRGYFDEEMNQILSDPSDDTKGFFDPNTHENLTYLQLLQRCVQDPDTGLYMLDVKRRLDVSFEKENILKTRNIRIEHSIFQDKDLSIWELLNSEFISVEKREELLGKFNAGTLSIDELITIITEIIAEPGPKLLQMDAVDSIEQETGVQASLQSEKVDVSVGDFRGQNVSIWELLHSHYINEDKRKQILEKLESGTITIHEVLTVLITIITETEVTSTGVIRQCEAVTVQQPFEAKLALPDRDIQKALQSISIYVSKGDYAMREVSVWDLLYSKYISEEKRQELLGNYKLTLQDIIQLVIQSIEESDLKSSKVEFDLKEEIRSVVQTVQIEISEGEFKGQKQSMWDLLNSRYFYEEKRQELLQKLNSGSLTIEELHNIIITAIRETEERGKSLKFKGLRRQVTATELLTSEIIDQKTLRDLAQGRKTIEDVNQMENVRRYLEGTSCIAGVLVPSTKDPSKKDKMSIYNAMLKNILRPGTALVLLEAQAATGFIIDPVNNKKLSVDEAAAASVIGQELYKKLLSAEKAVTGYTDPYTGDKISLFQAMQKGLIVKDHGIRLLEAQIATGGIIDPVHSHRLPVEVAYKRGYFDEEMNQILSDPTDDTKGFFDPNTHENLTYLQLVSRCVHDPETGLYMLEMKDKNALPSEKSFERGLLSLIIQINIGQYKGKPVSSWELLHSKYFTEEKRKSLLSQYKSRNISTEKLTSLIISTIEEWEEQSSKQSVNGFSLEEAAQVITEENKRSLLQSQFVEITSGQLQGQKLSVWDLLNSEYVDANKRDELLIQYFSGVLTLEEIIRTITVIITEVREKAITTQTIATKSIKPVITSDLNTALRSIFVNVKSDQLQEQKRSLWEILHSDYLPEDRRKEQLLKHQVTVEKLKQVIASLIEGSEAKPDGEVREVLDGQLAEVSVGEFRGQKVSVWSLLHSKYITEERRRELLEKYKSEVLMSEELLRLIITIIEETEQTITIEEELRPRLQQKLTEVGVGEFLGQSVSVWFLLHSRYITEEKRRELLEKYKSGIVTDEEIIKIIITIIEETEKRQQVKSQKEIQQELEIVLTEISVGEFKGQKVSVWFLLFSKYVTEEKRNEMLRNYASGAQTAEEILKIIITIIEETERSRELKFKGLRRQVTVTELLQSEIIDQGTLNELTQGSKTVEEVTQMDLVKRYLEGTSSIAGVFVTSKTDPSQREKLSIYDAMLKRILRPGTALILLEAQAATGFVIDPIQNKKLSVEEALAAGLIGHEIYEKLLSAERGVTGYNDPYTGQKISLFQAMKKDLIVKDHGIRLLEAQIATGGIIDPIHSHRVPVEVAYKRGYFDEEMNQILSDPSDDTKGFFDPNTHENLTYLQLLQRCVQDPDTGLFLLDVNSGASVSQEELRVKSVLQSRTVPITVGEFQGKDVSVWDLLYSRYVSVEKQQELLNQYRSGFLTIEELITLITTFITEIEVTEDKSPLQSRTVQVATGEFQGKDVSVWDLLYSRYISEEQREDLLHRYHYGTLTVEEIITMLITYVTEIEEVDVMSPLQTRTVQVTTGEFQGKDISVWDLLSSRYISAEKQQELLNRYRSGSLTIEELITIITTFITEIEEVEVKSTLQSKTVQLTVGEFQGKDVSVWDLLYSRYVSEKQREDLLHRYHYGTLTIEEIITMLLTYITDIEATEDKSPLQSKTVQVTTGEFQGKDVSVWDLLYSRYISEEQREDLLHRYHYGTLTIEEIITMILTYITEIEEIEVKSPLQSKTVQVTVGEFQGKDVSVWDLLYSHYISVEKQQELLNRYRSGSLTIEELVTILLTFITEIEVTEDKSPLQSRTVQVTTGEFQGKDVSVWDLLYSRYISEEQREDLLHRYHYGTLTIEEIITMILTYITEIEEIEVKSPLQSKTVQVTVGEFQGKDVSVWDLLYSHYISVEKQQELLNRYRSGSLTIEELVTILLTFITEIEVTEDKSPLQSRTVQVTTGEFQGKDVSVWDLLYSRYISEEQREDLLHRYHYGSLTIEEIITMLITYVTEIEEVEVKSPLQSKTVLVTVGEFQGKDVSIWDLLYSRYVLVEHREDLLHRYRSGSITIEELITIIIKYIEETEKSRELKFKGLRRQVTATELLQSEIIDQGTLNELTQGSKTVEEVTQMDSVKRYLEGTSSIAGVFVTLKTDPSQREKLSIYDAMLKRILRPGTALILLEAQAATGFVIDPIQNKKLSVEEALAAGLIGREIYDKLLSAERGVTGYNDPYTGQKISLFQAMKKDLIVKDHGIRLLEAQIATGGIIDPVHSHRVPVEVAYKRGYFDEEMNQILSDPSDDTKGFFDPNTHENLTYLQLLQRCVQDPDTGLFMLDVNSGASVSQEELRVKSVLQSKTVPITAGEFQGKDVSVWDLLYSRYVSVEKQKELLNRYRSGSLTIEELITIITTFITEIEEEKADEGLSPEIKAVKKSFLSVKVDITIGNFHEKLMSLWDLLHSKYIPEEKRAELIEKFRAGTLSIEEIINIVLITIQKSEGQSSHTVFVQEVQMSSESDQWPPDDQLQKALQAIPSDLSGTQVEQAGISIWDLLQSESLSEENRAALLQTYKSSVMEVMSTCTHIINGGEIQGSTTETIIIDKEKQKPLEDATTEVSVGQFKGHRVSAWNLLNSKYLTLEKKKEILVAYLSGTLTVEEIIKRIMAIIEESESRSSNLKIERVQTQNFLQSVEVDVTVGQLDARKYFLWELLHSSYFTAGKRDELIGGYESGAFGLEALIETIMPIIMEAEKTSVHISCRQSVQMQTQQMEAVPEAVLYSLQILTVSISSAEFTGDLVTLWDVLHSSSISADVRQGLLYKYYLTVKGMVSMLTNTSSTTVIVTSEKPDTETFLKSVTVQVNIGEFKLEGQSHSLWELLHSKYITEEKRKALIAQFESEEINWEQMFHAITDIIKESEERSQKLKFKA